MIRLTLKLKMNIAIVAAFIIIALIFTVIELPFQNQRLQSIRENVILTLHTLVERDVEPLANEIFDQSVRSITIRLEKMMRIKGVHAIHIFDSTGKLLASKGPDRNVENPLNRFTPPPAEPTVIRTVRIHGQPTIDYTREISIIGERIGFIQIHYSLEQIEREQKRAFILFTGLLTTVFIVMTILLNQILSRTIIQPITDLRDAMERIRRKKGSSEQVRINKNDEIGDLSSTFNHMASELTRSYLELEKQNQALLISEKEINQVRKYLKNIIDSMPSILAGVDNQGRITQWNAEAQTATGITANEALGLLYPDALPWADKMPLSQIKDAIVQKKVIKKSKVEVTIRNERHYIDITVFPLTQAGRNEAVIRMDDATERFKMEEMMIQSEKMLSVGGLAAGMAHEINNPLAGMIQNADVISNRLMEDLPATLSAAKESGTHIDAIREFMEKREIPRLLENIRGAGMIAADIVKNMLSFARKNERGKTMCHIGRLLDETIALAKSEYNLKKRYDFKLIKITKQYEDRLPEVPCEPGQIQQVFLNILTNGAQAMFQHKQAMPLGYEPRIHVKAFVVQGIDAQAGNDEKMMQIEISDNGPGMDEHTRKRVFEPFFTTKDQGEGTGLGLSVSYFIIRENHGGEMDVDSYPGTGTTFRITLPLEVKNDR
ncbi:MAG: HAMP domain-containing protein [Desulfobacteraceae bacterium]|nr:MAG: HAMP domain-containing protein [Desulfobacteraceae bacterium]